MIFQRGDKHVIIGLIFFAVFSYDNVVFVRASSTPLLASLFKTARNIGHQSHTSRIGETNKNPVDNRPPIWIPVPNSLCLNCENIQHSNAISIGSSGLESTQSNLIPNVPNGFNGGSQTAAQSHPPQTKHQLSPNIHSKPLHIFNEAQSIGWTENNDHSQMNMKSPSISTEGRPDNNQPNFAHPSPKETISTTINNINTFSHVHANDLTAGNAKNILNSLLKGQGNSKASIVPESQPSVQHAKIPNLGSNLGISPEQLAPVNLNQLRPVGQDGMDIQPPLFPTTHDMSTGKSTKVSNTVFISSNDVENIDQNDPQHNAFFLDTQSDNDTPLIDVNPTNLNKANNGNKVKNAASHIQALFNPVIPKPHSIPEGKSNGLPSTLFRSTASGPSQNENQIPIQLNDVDVGKTSLPINLNNNQPNTNNIHRTSGEAGSHVQQLFHGQLGTDIPPPTVSQSNVVSSGIPLQIQNAIFKPSSIALNQHGISPEFTDITSTLRQFQENSNGDMLRPVQFQSVSTETTFSPIVQNNNQQDTNVMHGPGRGGVVQTQSLFHGQPENVIDSVSNVPTQAIGSTHVMSPIFTDVVLPSTPDNSKGNNQDNQGKKTSITGNHAGNFGSKISPIRESIPTTGFQFQFNDLDIQLDADKIQPITSGITVAFSGSTSIDKANNDNKDKGGASQTESLLNAKGDTNNQIPFFPKPLIKRGDKSTGIQSTALNPSIIDQNIATSHGSFPQFTDIQLRAGQILDNANNDKPQIMPTNTETNRIEEAGSGLLISEAQPGSFNIGNLQMVSTNKGSHIAETTGNVGPFAEPKTSINHMNIPIPGHGKSSQMTQNNFQFDQKSSFSGNSFDTDTSVESTPVKVFHPKEVVNHVDLSSSTLNLAAKPVLPRHHSVATSSQSHVTGQNEMLLPVDFLDVNWVMTSSSINQNNNQQDIANIPEVSGGAGAHIQQFSQGSPRKDITTPIVSQPNKIPNFSDIQVPAAQIPDTTNIDDLQIMPTSRETGSVGPFSEAKPGIKDASIPIPSHGESQMTQNNFKFEEKSSLSGNSFDTDKSADSKPVKVFHPKESVNPVNLPSPFSNVAAQSVLPHHHLVASSSHSLSTEQNERLLPVDFTDTNFSPINLKNNQQNINNIPEHPGAAGDQTLSIFHGRPDTEIPTPSVSKPNTASVGIPIQMQNIVFNPSDIEQTQNGTIQHAISPEFTAVPFPSILDNNNQNNQGTNTMNTGNHLGNSGSKIFSIKEHVPSTGVQFQMNDINIQVEGHGIQSIQSGITAIVGSQNPDHQNTELFVPSGFITGDVFAQKSQTHDTNVFPDTLSGNTAPIVGVNPKNIGKANKDNTAINDAAHIQSLFHAKKGMGIQIPVISKPRSIPNDKSTRLQNQAFNLRENEPQQNVAKQHEVIPKFTDIHLPSEEIHGSNSIDDLHSMFVNAGNDSPGADSGIVFAAEAKQDHGSHVTSDMSVSHVGVNPVGVNAENKGVKDKQVRDATALLQSLFSG